MITKISCIVQKLELVSKLQVRLCSVVPKFKLLGDIEKSIEDEKIKPRKHPGLTKNTITQLPEWLDTAMRQSIEDANADQNQLVKEQKKLSNYLFSRRLPTDEQELKKNYFKIERSMLGQNLEDLSEDKVLEVRKQIHAKVKNKLKQSVFAWKPLDYNNYRSLLYMISRSPAEYSTLNSIFREIKNRDPKFNPQTIFDFGSGVGSVAWAATQYWKQINEYVGIDISNDMNDLAEKIWSHSPVKIKGIYYRRYLPISNLQYDLVVSAYTLMDLPDARSRLEVLSKLWRKTNKYLVIVEQGTNAGFTLINEARDFIKYTMENLEKESNYFTLAPCPHDLACPRFAKGETPCNFLSQYKSLPLLGPSKPTNELYSYFILKKGIRAKEDNWYRIVRPTIARSRHARCRLCTPDGKLQEVVFTASKYGKALYKCAKVSSWGDRLPIESNMDPLENVTQASDFEVTNDLKNQNSKDNVNSESKDNSLNEDKNQIIISEAPISSLRNDS